MKQIRFALLTLFLLFVVILYLPTNTDACAGGSECIKTYFSKCEINARGNCVTRYSKNDGCAANGENFTNTYCAWVGQGRCEPKYTNKSCSYTPGEDEDEEPTCPPATPITSTIDKKIGINPITFSLAWDYTIPSSCAGTGYRVEILPKTDLDVNTTNGCNNMTGATVIDVAGNNNKSLNIVSAYGLKWNTAYCWRVSTVGATNNSTSGIYTFRTNHSPQYVQTRLRFYSTSNTISTTPKCTVGGLTCNQNTSTTNTYIGGDSCWISADTTSPNTEKSIYLEFEYADPDTTLPIEIFRHRFAFVPTSKINEETPLEDTVVNPANYSFIVVSDNIDTTLTPGILNNLKVGVNANVVYIDRTNNTLKIGYKIDFPTRFPAGRYNVYSVLQNKVYDSIANNYTSYLMQDILTPTTNPLNDISIVRYRKVGKINIDSTKPTLEVINGDVADSLSFSLQWNSSESGQSGLNNLNTDGIATEGENFNIFTYGHDDYTYNTNIQKVITRSASNNNILDNSIVSSAGGSYGADLSTFTVGEFVPTQKWDFTASADGWGNQVNISRVMVIGGSMSMMSATNDPYIHSPIVSIDANQNRYIKIRFASSGFLGNDTVQIFFTTTTDGTWNEAKSKAITVQNSVSYNEYTIDMSTVPGWSGTVNRLRLDPSSIARTNSNLDYFYVGHVPQWDFKNSIEGWTNNGYISNYKWGLPGHIEGTSTWIDPYITSPDNLNTNIGDSNVVVIRLENSTASDTAQFFFTTTLRPLFDETKSKKIDITPNSGYKEYYFDMRNIAGWEGQLKQIRLDPGNNSGAFKIDYIKIGKVVYNQPIQIKSAKATLIQNNTVNAHYYFPSVPVDSYLNLNRTKIAVTNISDNACNLGENKEYIFNVNDSWTSSMQSTVVSDGSISLNVPLQIKDSENNLDIGNGQSIYKKLDETVSYLSTNFLASGIDSATGNAKNLSNESLSQQSIAGYNDINDTPINFDVKSENWFDYFENVMSTKQVTTVQLKQNSWTSVTTSEISNNQCAPSTLCYITTLGDLELNNVTCNTKSVFIVNGNLTILNDFKNANINSACLFVTSGNINIKSSGTTKDETYTNGLAPYDLVEAYLISNSTISTEPDINFVSNKGYMDGLVIRGGLVGRNVVLARELGLRNNIQPSEVVIYDSRYIHLLDEILSSKTIFIREE